MAEAATRSEGGPASDEKGADGDGGDGEQSAEEIIGQIQDQLDQHWIMREDSSPIDDSPRVVIVNRADQTEGVSGWRDKPRMILRCRRNETNMYVIVGDYLGSDGRKSVTYRFGDQPAQQASWSTSTDNDAVGLWSGGQAIDFMKRLLDVTRFVFNVTPYNSAPVTAVFKTGELRDKLETLSSACNWSLDPEDAGGDPGGDTGGDPGEADAGGADQGGSGDDEGSAGQADENVERWLTRPEIRSVQRALAFNDYYDGPIDGLIGPKTRAAVRAAQRSEWSEDEVTVDGRIDRQLLDRLDVPDVDLPDPGAG